MRRRPRPMTWATAAVLLLIACAAPRLASAQQGAQQGAQQRIVRGHGLAATASVRVFAMAGSVTVTGWDRDSIHVEGTVGAGLTPHVGGTRTGYKVTTYDGRQDETSPSHLTIRVPRRVQLWIKTTTAGITVRDVDGSLDLYSIEGGIDVAGAPGELRAETMRGAVTLAGTPRWVRAKSGSGAVRFTGSAQDIALSTVSGAIGSSSRFDRGRFESVRGAITVTGALRPSAMLDVDDHDGDVTLRLATPVSAAFTVYTFGGSITSDLAVARPVASRRAGRELAFTSGAGDARVTVRTYGGDVALEKSAPAAP